MTEYVQPVFGDTIKAKSYQDLGNTDKLYEEIKRYTTIKEFTSEDDNKKLQNFTSAIEKKNFSKFINIELLAALIIFLKASNLNLNNIKLDKKYFTLKPETSIFNRVYNILISPKNENDSGKTIYSDTRDKVIQTFIRYIRILQTNLGKDLSKVL